MVYDDLTYECTRGYVQWLYDCIWPLGRSVATLLFLRNEFFQNFFINIYYIEFFSGRSRLYRIFFPGGRASLLFVWGSELGEGAKMLTPSVNSDFARRAPGPSGFWIDPHDCAALRLQMCARIAWTRSRFAWTRSPGKPRVNDDILVTERGINAWHEDTTYRTTRSV